MTAVFDTSPICYLILIGETEWIPRFFSRILIPATVSPELTAPGAPHAVATWIARPPTWLEVAQPSHREPPAALLLLDKGERDAILLAQQVSAEWTILDEKLARQAAWSLGLPVMGVLGILSAAAEKIWVVLPEALARLQQTNFRASATLLRKILEGHRSSI